MCPYTEEGWGLTHVCFVSQWYDPETGSAFVPGEIARSLKGANTGIEVVTGFPNYPVGSVYPGYHQSLRSQEVRDGVKVTRVPLIPTHSKSGLKRAVGFASFAASSTLLGLTSCGRPDVYLVYGSPVTSGLGPTLARRFTGTPVVTYVSDLWPDVVRGSGITSPGALGRRYEAVARGIARTVYSASDGLVATSPGMLAELEKRYPTVKHMRLIYNWVDESVFYPRSRSTPTRSELVDPGQFLAMYAGNLGYAQNPLVWIDLAERLKDRADIVLAIVGDGPLGSQMRRIATNRSLANVKFLGPQSLERSAELIAASDLQLVSLDASAALSVALPSKIQVSMALAKPILLSGQGEAAQVVTMSAAGHACSSGDVAGLAESLRNLVDGDYGHVVELGGRARDFYESRMSRAVGVQHLVELLEAVQV